MNTLHDVNTADIMDLLVSGNPLQIGEGRVVAVCNTLLVHLQIYEEICKKCNQFYVITLQTSSVKSNKTLVRKTV